MRWSYPTETANAKLVLLHSFLFSITRYLYLCAIYFNAIAIGAV